jgi:hypothetical protein
MFTIGIDMNKENSSPPHVVDSGASVMKVSELQKQTPRTLAEKVHSRERRIEYLMSYVAELEKGLESSLALNRAQADESFDRTASHMAGEYVSYPAKTLTDEEIWEVINRTAWVGTEEEIRFKIAEAILRKAQEK